MKIIERQIVHIAIVVIVVVLLTGTMGILFANLEPLQDFGSFVFFVFMVGTVGGIANNYRRLQRLPLVAEEATEEARIAQRLVTIQIYLSPLIGGVFAVVLYVIFMAGMLGGDFFPAFQCAEDVFIDAPHFADCTLPQSNSDAAKALVWGFIAGFIEGFVPNFIDRLAKEQTAKVGTQEDKSSEESAGEESG